MLEDSRYEGRKGRGVEVAAVVVVGPRPRDLREGDIVGDELVDNGSGMSTRSQVMGMSGTSVEGRRERWWEVAMS